MNKISVHSLQSPLLLFLDKRDDFFNKNEEFYNPSIKKILTTINGMPHQLFATGLQARDIYPEQKKYIYREHSDVTWEEYLTTKFALLIDRRSSTDNTLHRSGRIVGKVVYYFRLKKYLRLVLVILHATFLALKMQWPTLV